MHLPARSVGKTEVHAQRSLLARRVGLRALAFVHMAELGGAVLFVAALAAMIWANSPWRDSYIRIFQMPVELTFGEFSLAPPGHGGSVNGIQAPDAESAAHGVAAEAPAETASHGHAMTLHDWINDGLMVIFFFVVGLEIKRELVVGSLSGLRRAAFPAMVALGGMILPATIYAVFNVFGPEGSLRGWGIPMATDIAFALGVLALLGDRVPGIVRVMLLAFAIVDDIGAILVIAVFYTESLSMVALGGAVALVGVIYIMQRVGVLDVGPYLFVGTLVWACTLVSGVHATIAGALLGLLTPARPWFSLDEYSQALDTIQRDLNKALSEGDTERAELLLGKIEKLTQGTEPVLDRLIRLVHPWSAFVVLPVFALANAGVILEAEAISAALRGTVLWGVLFGLLFGKPLGTTGLSWLASKAGWVTLPDGMSWKHVFGIGLLGGIGFTVALFITELAFEDLARLDGAKMGILIASVISGIAGLTYFRFFIEPSANGNGSAAAVSSSTEIGEASRPEI